MTMSELWWWQQFSVATFLHFLDIICLSLRPPVRQSHVCTFFYLMFLTFLRSYVIEVMNKFVFLHFRIVQRIKDGRCMASRANTIRAKEEFILLLLNIQLLSYFNHGKIETISNSIGLVNNFALVGILSFMNLAKY